MVVSDGILYGIETYLNQSATDFNAVFPNTENSDQEMAKAIISIDQLQNALGRMHKDATEN